MSKLQRRWSPQEDSILQREVEHQCEANSGVVRDWNSIAKRIKGRSNKDCRKRFYNGITKGLKKGPWTNEEDKQLEKLVRKHGPSWAVIAQDMKTRSADQCSKRWQHCLDPELDRSSWSQEENLALLNAVRTHESAWKDIQTLHFPRRSANNVKNQYSALKRKGLKGMANALPCCSNGASNHTPTKQGRWSSEESTIAESFGMDFDKASSDTMDTDSTCPELEHSVSFPMSENEDSFQWLNSETESTTMTPESAEDFGSFNPLGSIPVDSLGGQAPSSSGLKLETVTDLDFADPLSGSTLFEQPQIPTGLPSCDSPTQKSLAGHALSYNAFSSPADFAMDSDLQQPASPGSVSSTLPSLTAQNSQLTIRIDGADPSTLSAVMGTLIQSKARFKFDNY